MILITWLYLIFNIKSKHYANSESEEKEAEVSIHQEALERSRISVGAAGQVANDICFEDNDDDDWGGDEHDGYDREDVAFDDFIAMNANNKEVGIDNGNSFVENNMSNGTANNMVNSTSVVLEAICGTDLLQNESQYGYFDPKALKNIMSGNNWAGVAHWKKNTRDSKKPPRLMDEEILEATTEKKKKKNTIKKKPKKKEVVYLDFHKSIPDNAFLLPTKPKRSKVDPLQLSNAAKQRQSHNDNLLPLDAQINVEHLSNLFLIPNSSCRTITEPRLMVPRYEKRVGKCIKCISNLTCILLTCSSSFS